MKIFFSYLYIVFLKMSTISMHIFGNQETVVWQKSLRTKITNKYTVYREIDKVLAEHKTT